MANPEEGAPRRSDVQAANRRQPALQPARMQGAHPCCSRTMHKGGQARARPLRATPPTYLLVHARALRQDVSRARDIEPAPRLRLHLPTGRARKGNSTLLRPRTAGKTSVYAHLPGPGRKETRHLILVLQSSKNSHFTGCVLGRRRQGARKKIPEMHSLPVCSFLQIVQAEIRRRPSCRRARASSETLCLPEPAASASAPSLSS